MGIPYEIVGKYGIIATIKGAKPGRTIALRADMDALPIEEKIDKPYASKIKGVKHACGHDGHMAMLLGAAKAILDVRDSLNGTALLCFEQAEENGMGSRAILEGLAKRKVDGVYGMHLYSSLSTGQVFIGEGPVMSALNIFMVEVQGKGGHGSTPHLSIDPIQIAAEMIVNLASIQSRELSPYDVVAITIGKFNAGTKGNIIPPKADFTGSIRYFDKKVGDKVEEAFKRIVSNVAEAHRAKAKIRYIKPVPSTVNDPEYAKIATKSLIKVAGKEAVADMKPWMASESFASYTSKYPGVFAIVGIKNPAKGTDYDHHTPEFDIDEDALKIGVALTVQYTLDFLNTK